MTVRGEKRPRARAHVEAFAGVLARDGARAAAVPTRAAPRAGARGAARGERAGRAAARARPRRGWRERAPTAIVTGGGRGIGAAVARALTARGVRGDGVRADRRAARAGSSREGGAALAVAGDVAREEDVARLVAEHERRSGPSTCS